MTGQNTRRTVTANITLSLDGRVSGPGGEYDMGWIVPHATTSKSRDHMVSVTGTATTALLGRKNYEGFAGFWPAVADDENADPRDREFSRWLNAVEKVVFSTTLDAADWRNTRLVKGDLEGEIRRMKAGSGEDLAILGSGSLVAQLTQARLIDEYQIVVDPVVLGQGRSLFAGVEDRVPLKLLSTRAFANGNVLLCYAPKP